MTMTMKATLLGVLSWFFPDWGGGEERGLNDSGIETFKRKKSLGRETIQNILDARSKAAQDAGEPAKVELGVVRIPRSVFPATEGFTKVVKACLEYTRLRFDKPEDQDANGTGFLERALGLLSQETVPALRIRDRNTTGLVGGDEEWNRPYYRLIRGQGYSKSEGVGGGTYGIGQRAPFAFSPLRTVLYYSRLPDESELFVGKSVLCTHKDVDSGSPTQNVGWYCRRGANASEWAPVREVGEIDDFFRRSEVGTDLYVTGYDEDDFEYTTTRDVLHNFFGAISGGILEVSIGETVVGKENLHETLEAFVSDAYEKSRERKERKADLKRGIGAAFFWAKALRDGTPFTTTIDRLGEVKLFVVRDSQAPCRVAYMRKPRILVFDKGNNALTNYAAVAVVDSDEGNEYLAKLEDPAHERWHHDEPRNWTSAQRMEAQETLRELNRWIRDTLAALRGLEAEDEQDVPELGDLLPAEDEEGAFDADGATMTSDETTADETAQKAGASMAAKVRRLGPRGRGPTSHAGAGTETGGGPKRGSGGGKKGKKSKKSRKQKKRGLIPVRFRAFTTGTSSYQLVMESPTKASGDLTLQAYGEDGSYTYKIKSATDGTTGRPIATKDMTLKGVALQAGRVRRIDLVLDSPVPLSLGVRD
jgi:hypothetical protein